MRLRCFFPPNSVIFRLLKMAATTTTPAGELRPGVAALQALFKSDATEGQSADGAWNRAWKSATTPWDNLGVQPALKELVEENWAKTGVNWESLSGGRSLVAGCGRVSRRVALKYEEADKHDAGVRRYIFRSERFPVAWSRYCSRRRRRRCRVASQGRECTQQRRFVRSSFRSSRFELTRRYHFSQCLDFFASPALVPGSFALAYDYTFLCAIPPSLRPKWAARYAELIRPGGVLIALQFPLDGDRAGGPPFSLSPQIYDDLLLDKFT